jgi:hypothetical protein
MVVVDHGFSMGILGFNINVGASLPNASIKSCSICIAIASCVALVAHYSLDKFSSPGPF